MKFLPDILTLQKDLVKRFQNVTDLPFETIADFLHSQKTGTEFVLSEPPNLSKKENTIYLYFS